MLAVRRLVPCRRSACGRECVCMSFSHNVSQDCLYWGETEGDEAFLALRPGEKRASKERVLLQHFSACLGCARCFNVCPTNAITYRRSGKDKPQYVFAPQRIWPGKSRFVTRAEYEEAEVRTEEPKGQEAEPEPEMASGIATASPMEQSS
jgi:NAD-dependent dihydropyrimidine dehydrogenase PreA subunit